MRLKSAKVHHQQQVRRLWNEYIQQLRLLYMCFVFPFAQTVKICNRWAGGLSFDVFRQSSLVHSRSSVIRGSLHYIRRKL